MGLVEDMTRRVRKLDIIDVKLAQSVAFFLALIIAKLIPDIMDINIWWFVVRFGVWKIGFLTCCFCF